MSSSAQPIESTPTSRPINFWIVNWWQDLMWFVAPPLFLVPLFAVMLKRIPLEQLSLLVVTFGAVGHHLPGMLRAYGDAELFQRYRVRFIVAPLFLIAVSIYYSFYRSDVLSVMLLSWGFWHSQAQVYGFLRIYDSKVGQTTRHSAWIDRLLCLSWFGGAIAMSDGRLTDFFKVYYRTGGVMIDANFISFLRTLFIGLMVISATLYLIRLMTLWKNGSSPNPAKLMTLILSIGFWWYCMVGVRNVILGVALYEVFHDVQYLAIVWFFNRRRVTAGKSPGWVTQLLFQPRFRWVVLYIALVLGYGASSLMIKSLDTSVLQTVLSGLFAASGFLHFYYDGFIWRLREKQMSETLGVEHTSTAKGALLRNLSRWKHAALWLLFVVPLLAFTFSSRSSDVHGQVVQTLPESDDANLNYASYLLDNGDLVNAKLYAQQSLAMDESWSKPWLILGEIELARGNPQSALDYLNHAVELEPLNAIAQFNRGDALIKLRRIPEGVAAYEEASRLDSKYETSALNNLGVAMLSSGAYEEAENAFREAIAADPSHLDARLNLAQTLVRLQHHADAIELYQDIVGNRPDYPAPYPSLVRLLIHKERYQEAAQVIETFQINFPDDISGLTLEGYLNLALRRYSVANNIFEQVLRTIPTDFKARYGLVQLRIQVQQFQKAFDLIEEMQKDLSNSQENIMLRELRQQLAMAQRESGSRQQ